MTDSFSLQSSQSRNRLTFEAVGNAVSRGEWFGITLVADGLSADVTIYDGRYSTTELPALLKGLAADWRGWEGSRHWKSLEGDLNLRFSWGKTGHVTVDVELSKDFGVPEPWKVDARLVLEVGMLEELANLANRFFSYPIE